MELIFLGTGTSTGVPMVATEKHQCDIENPKNWRTRTSAHVIIDGFHIQIDASPELRLQCLWNKIEWVDLVILTHGHSDHVMGMDDLRRFCTRKGGNALDIYSCEDGLKRMKESFAYAIRDKPKYEGYPAFALHDFPIMPGELKLECGTIQATLLPHGNFEVLGLVFKEKRSGKRLAYYTDCHEVTPQACEMAHEVDLLVIDGLRHKPHVSHLTLQEASAVSQKMKAKQTYLTHMGHWVDYERDRQLLPNGVDLAYDGLRVQL